MSNTAWIIFGKNGQSVTSQNFPSDLQGELQNGVQTQGWVVNNIFCYPDTRGFLVLLSNGKVATYGSFPADLAAAVSSLNIPSTNPQLNVSWQANDVWAVFCPGVGYKLGPNVPSQVTTLLANYNQSNAADQTRYSPTNLIFSPSGDWLLIGYDQSDEGSGTYNSSSGFPADVLAAANNLPDHTGVANVVFDPDGGWAMTDSSGNIQWGSGTPSDIQTAEQNFVKAGNSITGLQFVTIGTYVMPMQFSFGLSGPMNPASWTNQSVNMGTSITPASPNGAQKITTPYLVPTGAAAITSGTNAAGQNILTLSSVSGLAVGQLLTINPGGSDQEQVTISGIGVAMSNGIPVPLAPTQIALTAPLKNSHAAGETVTASLAVITPSDTSWMFAVPSSTIVIPFNFSFNFAGNDPGGFGGAPGGNHAHFVVQLEQVQLDGGGNVIIGSNGQPWQAVGSPLIVDLYGNNCTNQYGSPQLNIPEQGDNQIMQIMKTASGTIQQNVWLPVPLTQVQTILRLQFVCWLGDTNDSNYWDYGPMESVGVLNEGGAVTCEFPASGQYTLAQWVIGVVPTELIQIKAMPIALIYNPPGNASNASYALSNTNTYSWTFSDSESNNYSVTNDISSTAGSSISGSGSLGFSFMGFGLSLGASNSAQTSQTWDNSTTQGTQTSSGNTYTLSQSQATNLAWQTGGNPWPGDTAPVSQEAFQADTFTVLVRVQLAIWDYPNFYFSQVLGSWPTLYTVSVEQLVEVINGGASAYSFAPPPGASMPCSLNAQDCAALLSLDPFYASGWQGADLSTFNTNSSGVARFQPITSVNYGSTVLSDGAPPANDPVTVQSVVSNETTYKQSYSLTYTSGIETKYSFTNTQSNSINFGVSIKEGVVQASGSGSQGSSSSTTISNSTSTTLSINYQSTASVDYKSVYTYTGSLNDNNPYTTTSGAAQAGATVLPIKSTTGLSVKDQIIINPNYPFPPKTGTNTFNASAPNTEVATIASIQTNASVTLTAPLKYAHVAAENVLPVWNEMTVNAYRDLLYGGLAFQDPNAAQPLRFVKPPILPLKPVILTPLKAA